jgi:hypothetical protein
MFWKLVTPELLESLPDGTYSALDADRFTVNVKITNGKPNSYIKWIWYQKKINFENNS